MEDYDPAKAGLGQVYGDGGRKWQQTKDQLQEVEIEGGRAVAAKDFVPANAEVAQETMGRIDAWLSSAAKQGRASE